MHTLSIPQSVVDRVIEKRGREHIYEDLDPDKTALIFVDMLTFGDIMSTDMLVACLDRNARGSLAAAE